MRPWLATLSTFACVFGAAGVGLAALGAHRSGSPAVTTAAFFLLFHAGALVGFCGIALHTRQRFLLMAATAIAVGTAMFSGELALHALGGIAALSPLAPIGGSVMIFGWLAAAIALPRALMCAIVAKAL